MSSLAITETHKSWPEKSTPWMSFDSLRQLAAKCSKPLFVQVITKNQKDETFELLGVKKHYGVILDFNEEQATYRIYKQVVAGGYFLIPSHKDIISKQLMDEDLQRVRVASKLKDLQDYEKPLNVTFHEDIS